MTLMEILRGRRGESPPTDYGPPPELLRPLANDDEARRLARSLSLGRASALQRLADTGQVCGNLVFEFRLLEDQWSAYPNWSIQVARLRHYVTERLYRLHASDPPAVLGDRYACEPCPFHSRESESWGSNVEV